jgi:hypothetical protein
MRTICRSARLNDRSLSHSFVDQISSAALVFCRSNPSTIRPRTLARSHKQNLRSSTCFHPVHNGSAQLSYFIYSCTVRTRSFTQRNSSPPSRAQQSKPKRALHPIHNVKQPKNKRRREAPYSFSILSISIARNQLVVMVGQGRFELPTSRLSSARSNQLSY